MSKRLDGFIWIGLGVSLLMALFFSPFASSSPDGLEKVAQMRGFKEKGEAWRFWNYAPLPDYALPWIKNEKASTALSGLLGTLAIFFIALGLGKLLKRPPGKKGVSVILFLLLPLFPSTSLYAGRPLTTDDAWTVEKGKFQVESGIDVSRQDNHDREFTPSLTLTYGLLERMDLGVGSGYLFFHPAEGRKENGIADTEIKLKYRFMDEMGLRPAFAVAGILKIPTASESKGLGSGKVDFRINTLFTKNLGKQLALHLNLGYAFLNEKGGDNEFNYSLACQFILAEKWTLVGEIAGINNFNGHKRDDPLSGLIGTTYQLTENLVWDAGVEIGMNRAAPDFRVTTGVTLFFKP
jgi:cobalt/nickel transport protein